MTTKLFAFGAVTLALAAQAHATGTTPAAVTPYALTGTNYAQDFNSLASTGGQVDRSLPVGWQIHELGTGTSYSNSNAQGYYYAGSSSGQVSAIGAVSYGQSPVGDRALGARAHADVPLTYFGAIFQNDLGGVIDSLTLNYTGEQWVNGFSRATLKFEYSLDATSVNDGNWISFSGLDFLAPNNDPQTPGGTSQMATTFVNGNSAAFSQQLSGVIDGLAIADGASFGLRWSLAYISTPYYIGGTLFDTTSNDGLAVDNFGLQATLAPPSAVPEPASWAMMIAGLGLVGGAMRRRAKLSFA